MSYIFYIIWSNISKTYTIALVVQLSILWLLVTTRTTGNFSCKICYELQKCIIYFKSVAILHCSLFHWICPNMEVCSILQEYQRLTKILSFKMNLPNTWLWWREEISIFSMFLIKMVSCLHHPWPRWIFFNATRNCKLHIQWQTWNMKRWLIRKWTPFQNVTVSNNHAENSDRLCVVFLILHVGVGFLPFTTVSILIIDDSQL